MNENMIEAKQKFPMQPVAPLGVIAMRGCEEMGKRVNDFLMNWQVNTSDTSELHSYFGSEAEGFLLKANCPRFGTGEKPVTLSAVFHSMTHSASWFRSSAVCIWNAAPARVPSSATVSSPVFSVSLFWV